MPHDDDSYQTALTEARVATAHALAAIERVMLAHGDRDADESWSALHNAWESQREAAYVAAVLASGGRFTEHALANISTQARQYFD